jgi:hypothetical protein
LASAEKTSRSRKEGNGTTAGKGRKTGRRKRKEKIIVKIVSSAKRLEAVSQIKLE